MALLYRTSSSTEKSDRALEEALAEALAEVELYRLGWFSLCNMPGLATLPALVPLLNALPARLRAESRLLMSSNLSKPKPQDDSLIKSTFLAAEKHGDYHPLTAADMGSKAAKMAADATAVEQELYFHQTDMAEATREVSEDQIAEAAEMEAAETAEDAEPSEPLEEADPSGESVEPPRPGTEWKEPLDGDDAPPVAPNGTDAKAALNNMTAHKRLRKPQASKAKAAGVGARDRNGRPDTPVGALAGSTPSREQHSTPSRSAKAQARSRGRGRIGRDGLGKNMKGQEDQNQTQSTRRGVGGGY